MVLQPLFLMSCQPILTFYDPARTISIPIGIFEFIEHPAHFKFDRKIIQPKFFFLLSLGFKSNEAVSNCFGLEGLDKGSEVIFEAIEEFSELGSSFSDH